jgi:hypothetical protein
VGTHQGVGGLQGSQGVGREGLQEEGVCQVVVGKHQVLPAVGVHQVPLGVGLPHLGLPVVRVSWV